MSTATIDQRLKEQAAKKLDKDLDDAFGKVRKLIGGKFETPPEIERLRRLGDLQDEARARLLPEYEEREVDEFMRKINEKPTLENTIEAFRKLRPIKADPPIERWPVFIPPPPYLSQPETPHFGPIIVTCRANG